MIPRPTTPDLIADCCRELTEHILPSLTDETQQVRLVMIETVLRNAAVRAAHEIAWLRAESAELLDFARAVDERHPDADTTRALARALPDGSLHLDAVVADYERASQAFDQALTTAREHGATDLVAAARELLRRRIETEKQVMATYAVVGR